MPNIKITDLPNAILPMDLTETFFEVQTVEAGIPVSRRASGDMLTFTTDDVIKGTSSDDPAVGGGVFDGKQTWLNFLSQQTASVGFEPPGDDFIIQNFAQDGEISLRVRDGSVHLATADYGVDIPTTGAIKLPVGTTGEEPAPVNGQIRYDSSTNRFRGVISGVWVDLDMGAIALNDLSDVTLTAPDTGGVLYKSAGDWLDTDAIVIDPAAGVSLKESGTIRLTVTADGADVFGQLLDVINSANSGASITWRDSDGGGRWNADGTLVTLSQTDGAGAISDTWIRCTTNGMVEVRHNGQNAMRTALQANGGLEAFNTATGAGFERVLTTADLGGAVALNDLTDVTLTAPATGGVLYKSAGDWLDTDTILITPGSDIQMNVELTIREAGAILRFNDAGDTPQGSLGTSIADMYLDNFVDDQSIFMRPREAGGTPRIGAEFTADGQILNHIGLERLSTQADGVDVSSNAGITVFDVISVTASGDIQVGLRGQTNGGMRLFYDEGLTRGFIQQTTAGGVLEDTWITLFENGAVELNFNDVPKLNTANGGIDVLGSTATAPASGGAQNTAVFLENLGGTAIGLLGFSAQEELAIASFVHGGNVEITAQQAGGATRNLFVGNPDSGSSIFHAATNVARIVTAAEGIQLSSDSSNNPAAGGVQDIRIIFANSLGNIVGFSDWQGTIDWTMQNSVHGGSILFEAQDSSGTVHSLISADPDDDVKLFDTNVEVARTLPVASGGFEIDNQATGAGFERVLTTADLGGGGALNDLSDVTLTAPATGGFLFKSAGDWIDTADLLLTAGTDLDLASGLSLNLLKTTAIDLVDNDNALNIGTLAGAHLAFDGNDIQAKSNATTATTLRMNNLGGGVLIGDDSIALIQLFGATVQLSNSAGTGRVDILSIQPALLDNNSNALNVGALAGTHIAFGPANIQAKGSASTAGTLSINTLGGQVEIGAGSGVTVSLNAALVDQDNSSDATATGFRIRNSEGGFEIVVDGDDTTFSQTASNAALEDTLIKFFNNDRTEFYFNGILEAATQQHNLDHVTSGLTAEDHGGNAIDVGWNLMPVIERDTSLTFAELHVSKMIHRDDTGAAAFTLPSGTTGAVPPVGSIIMLTNENATGAMTILASGTLRWLEGSGTPSTGTRTLAEGGICTVYHYSDTEWWIWGIGLS